jgi:forkhead box protein N
MTDELTNLNWLYTITTADSYEDIEQPIGKVLPSYTQMKSTSQKKYSSSPSFRLVNNYCKPAGVSKMLQHQASLFARPPCSYSCLIAMSLKASPTGCLPVHEIYRFVEQEYPFYKTAPEGWKNSIRHNLSMNQNFIKIQRPDGFQTKKGYYWAANPTRQHILDLEMERALKAMGRELVENSDTASKSHVTNSVIEEQVTINERHYCSPPQSPPIPNPPDEATISFTEQLNKVAGIDVKVKQYTDNLESKLLHSKIELDNHDIMADLFGISFNTEGAW